MRHKRLVSGLLAGGLLACSLAAVAQTPQPAATQGATPKTHAKQANKTAAADDAGELKFQQYCSRCHNAPQELSPRISGTIALHMRVRANLSQADELAIVRYLAP